MAGEDPRKAPLDIIGLSGLKRFSGYILEEFHPKLRGVLAVRVFTEMRDNDPIIGAFLHAIDMLIRQVVWSIKPYSEGAADVELARFVDECRNDMADTWEDLISEILSMLVFGYAPFEEVYKIRGGNVRDLTRASRFNDGKIGWRKMGIRSQDSILRWEFDEPTGELLGVWQYPPPDYRLRFIPVERLLLFRTRLQKGSPEGRSMLRNAYRPWYFKKRIEEIEAIGIERDLAGLPVLQVPPEIMMPDATGNYQTQYTAFKTLVSEIRRDEREGIIMPSELDREGKPTGYKLTLLSSGGRRQIDTNEILLRLRAEIAMTVLADFLTLGHEKIGSWSLSSDKTNLFSTALGAWLRSIAAVFNRFAIPRLFALNGFPLDRLPTLEPGDIESPSLVELGQFLQLTGTTGFMHPSPAVERKIREFARLPQESQPAPVIDEQPETPSTVSTTPGAPAASDTDE